MLALGHLRHEGVHPGLMEGLGEMSAGDDARFAVARGIPEDRAAPRRLPQAVRQEDADGSVRSQDVPAEAVRAIQAPTLLIIGDSDLVRPEHAVEMFRLLGGGVFDDNPGRACPDSQLAHPARHLARQLGQPRRSAASDDHVIS